MPGSRKPPEVGPWAKEKLVALHRYLDFYTKVLKNGRWRTVYVDAFAGGGQARIRQPDTSISGPSLLDFEPDDPEQQEVIAGSPRIALAIDNPFNRYVFIDPNGARVAELNALAAEYGQSRTISIRPGNAEDQVRWVLDQKISSSTHRGVAFLDPFGAHLSWNIIESLAATRLFEVLINFPLHMALARLMKNDAQIPERWRAQLDSFFGGEEWFREAYETGTLFETSPSKREDYLERLLELYRGKLKRAFGNVSRPKLIRNTRGSPLYYLLWAGPHPKGLQGANYILAMDERLPTGPRGGRPK